MARKEELAEVKSVISRNIGDANKGIFFTGNTEDDETETLFNGEFFMVDICYDWSYFEVFGCGEDERAELKEFYSVVRSEYRNRRTRG